MIRFRTYAALCLLFISCFTFSMLSAQEPCGTDHLHEQDLHDHAGYAEEIEASEQQYRDYLKDLPNRRTSGAVRTIPVVVHVIQSSKQELVTEAQVQSQLQVLNEDYRKMLGTPGFGKGVDVEIEFCLARIDPNGCPTSGINRVIDPVEADHTIGRERQLKALIQWDPNRYLNMWIPENIGQGILGYATFPFRINNSPQLDGVVVDQAWFGRDTLDFSDFYQGRVMTHEVGHWLGLFHTFQGGCVGTNPSTCASQGDLVCDTPPARNPNYGCPFGINSCTETPDDSLDMVENYMDYSNGQCQSTLTQGQKDRIDFHLQTYRPLLTSAANLTFTGCDGGPLPSCPPIAAFDADYLIVCPNQPILFEDNSELNPTSWNWKFPGGTPATSTMQNPQVTYSAPGIYDVTLSVTNSAGSDSLLQRTYIEVRQDAGIPFAESFEVTNPRPDGWTVINEDCGPEWERDARANHTGGFAIRMDNYSTSSRGSIDDLITENYDLDLALTAEVSFWYAYKRQNAFLRDTLQVWVSTDCGQTWSMEWELGGAFLATTSGFELNAQYVPQTADWVEARFDLTDYLGQKIRMRFRNIGNGGQMVWVDDINLEATVSNDRPVEQSWTAGLFPNPANDQVVLELKGLRGPAFNWELFDLRGRSLKAGEQNGNRVLIGLEDISKGVYFIRAQAADGSQRVLKLVRE